VEKDIHAIFT